MLFISISPLIFGKCMHICSLFPLQNCFTFISSRCQNLLQSINPFTSAPVPLMLISSSTQVPPQVSSSNHVPPQSIPSQQSKPTQYISSDPNFPSGLSIPGLITPHNTHISISLEIMRAHFPKIDLYQFHKHFAQTSHCSSITLTFTSHPIIELHTNNPTALHYQVELFFMACILSS